MCVCSIDYKNLSQAREHIEKYMFSPATQSSSSQEAFINEQGQKVPSSDRSPITA